MTVTEAERKHPININLMTLSQIKEKGLEHLLEKKKAKHPYFKPDSRFKVGNTYGSKHRSVKDRTWFSVSYWHKKLEREWPKLTENQRAGYSVDLMKMLTSKLNSLPVDPLDSKLNASTALEMMKGLEGPESKTVPPTSPTVEPTEKVEAVVPSPAIAPPTHESPSI